MEGGGVCVWGGELVRECACTKLRVCCVWSLKSALLSDSRLDTDLYPLGSGYVAEIE